MAVCMHPLSFELMDYQGTFLQQIPKMSIDEQIAEHIHRLEADLQDARQAREQAEFDRDGAVAEGVHLTQQRDKFQKMVQDLVQENVAFKAETAMANIKLHEAAMKVNNKHIAAYSF